MPNLVGIGNSQVPTNAMLGGLAYQDPAHANLINADITNISSLKGKITSTAVDVFVYDTRKDSDGGAWRKRCQRTSWYNEAPSAMRGPRKDFPAVAIIVLEKQQLFIYDGDDPDCSMWMRFDTSTASWSSNATFLSVSSGSGNPAKSCTALNGKLIVTGTYGVAIVDFINESQINRGRPGIAVTPLRHKKSGNISLRNDTSGQYILHSSLGYDVAIDDIINDCDATVLPNARIDDTTGLPIPTIALATDDGISIIDENGKIVDMTVTGETKQVKHIHFTESNDIAIKHYANWVFYYKRPTADSSATYHLSHPGYLGRFTDTERDYNTSFEGLPIKVASNGINNLVADRAIGHTNGLQLIDINVADSTLVGYGMHCGISTNFNSGWMVGNVTGAFLSDDDDTDISSAILQAQRHSSLDSTFASSGGWTVNADWTISGGKATCDGQNNGRWIYPNNSTMFPQGTSVIVEVEVVNYTSGTLAVSYGTGAATSGTNMTGIGTHHFADLCTGNGIIYLRSDSFVGSIDNVKMYIAEADRSHHDKGLAVYGTVTKTPVEPGADLVAYGGFTSSNFLRQPPNSAMNIGTGDAHLMIWYKTSNSSGTQMLISYEGGANGTTDYGKPFNIRFESGVVRGWASDDNFSTYDDVSHGIVTADGSWHHAAWVKRGETYELYVDGVFIGSDGGNATGALSDANSELVIGGRKRGKHPGDYCEEPFEQGSVALARIGKTAPTAKQIKKIYTDERKLFQEDAKCTLYGGDYKNAIALAYDDSTDILHVGTTSGRNEFSGLKRINNTTTAVTTAISASNGLVAEQ